MFYESEYYGLSTLGLSIAHHGIKGQKWYHRRFQNEDGTLTPAGKERYNTGSPTAGQYKRDLKKLNKAYVKNEYKLAGNEAKFKKAERKFNKMEKLTKKRGELTDRQQRKYDKLEAKYNKRKSALDENKAQRESVKKAVNDKIQEALKNDFNVVANAKYSDVHQGRHLAASLMLNARGYSGITSGKTKIEGKSYKVTKAREGKKAKYTDKSQKFTSQLKAEYAYNAARTAKAIAFGVGVNVAMRGGSYVLNRALSGGKSNNSAPGRNALPDFQNPIREKVKYDVLSSAGKKIASYKRYH